MAANERINMAVRVAGWGGESGMIVTAVGIVPVIFLSTYIAEDIGAAAMLLAYGLLFGHYLARRLARIGITGPEHSTALRYTPAGAALLGYAAIWAVTGVTSAESFTAIHGLLFGGVAGLILGVRLMSLPLAAAGGAPLPPKMLFGGALLVAGAVMGIVAGFVMSISLGWLFAMPVWQLGVGGAIGFFLAPPKP